MQDNMQLATFDSLRAQIDLLEKKNELLQAEIKLLRDRLEAYDQLFRDKILIAPSVNCNAIELNVLELFNGKHFFIADDSSMFSNRSGKKVLSKACNALIRFFDINHVDNEHRTLSSLENTNVYEFFCQRGVGNRTICTIVVICEHYGIHLNLTLMKKEVTFEFRSTYLEEINRMKNRLHFVD